MATRVMTLSPVERDRRSKSRYCARHRQSECWADDVVLLLAQSLFRSRFSCALHTIYRQRNIQDQIMRRLSNVIEYLTETTYSSVWANTSMTAILGVLLRL